MTDCATDQQLIASIIEFEWPCQKRYAHGPHDDLDTMGMSDEAIRRAQRRPLSEPTCPGVKAHPATMIGP